MSEPIRILGIAGSLRAQSYNLAALRAAQKLVPAGVTLELFPLGGIPPYNQDEERKPPQKVVDLKARIRNADGILLATPEYNYSIPGVLKNAIDWASRPKLAGVLRNKTVAVVGASTGQFGALWAQQDLKRILGIAGARVVGTEIPVARAHERFDNEGRLLDGEVFEQLRLHLTTLASEAVAAPERAAA
jgi:chromate reductase, NAD(P)H dehydrogenase (quinone)